MNLEVREMHSGDIASIVSYFTNATPEFLMRMGADPDKLPGKTVWIKLLEEELEKENKSKEFYYVIWVKDGREIGHSNINKISYSKNAHMHLHIWQQEDRKTGIGSFLIKQSIPYFFNKFKLTKLYCEPYAKNPAPNKTLRKLGFDFIKKYETIPGWINFRQEVNQYILTKEKFESTFKVMEI